MKYIISVVLFFVTSFCLGQENSYQDWKEEAKTNIRLLPKYGNINKSKEQKEADEELIKSYLAKEGTYRKASELLIKLGFDYLYRHDLKTAMYRFNQAWLLDPNNENVFWGFGAIYFSFQDVENALKQYEEGLKINPKSSNILTDKATVYMSIYMNSHIDADFDKAIKTFKQSYDVDPKNQNTLFKLSACYYTKGDCANALKYYDECKMLGGDPITEEYTKALKKFCRKK